ncbi:hypothetical protein Sango_1164000 [Sesamum angolense]|uniref:Uncharacterized protein n=1 Tax=Sesamum angolense TaxID=2727404 RepID=A0AAE2BWS0_9LAMI|nr:hypothetical protein Sango_1164000 [Sesamum angolense]
MPMGYQPPKFQQFDCKGNPKQHVAHFVETCNNARTYGDHLVKQFVRLLKDNAFDWYTDLETGSIDGWEQLEQEFLNRFYSTRRTISMVELTKSRQWEEEPVIDYINRSFEELATRAHDMELSMIASGVEGPPVQELRKNKEKQGMKKGGMPFSKAPSKASMAVSVVPFKLKSTMKDNIAPRNNVPYERPQRKLTLKEMQAREYPFLDSDVPGIFDDLLEANLIDLPKMKRPEEAERKNDPKYCKYHRLVGHAIQDCFVFKDNVIGEDLLLGSKPHNRPLFVPGYSPHDPRFQSRRTKDCRHYKDAIDYGGYVKKVLGDNKPFTEIGSHFADAKYYIEDAKKGKEVFPPEEPKSCNNQNIRKNDSSTLEVELSKGLTLPLTQINMKQPSKPPLKGFVPSTLEEEGGHVALAIDEKGFDSKAFKLLIKAEYDPKEKLSLGRLHPKTTGKKLHGLNDIQIMLREKGHAIQDSRVGLGFTPPMSVRIAIKRVNINYVSEGFSSTKDHKREENLRESVFNRVGPHIKELHGITNRQSIFDRVLKVKMQTVIFTQVQSDDEDDKESVASSNHISNCTEENIAQTYHITVIQDGEVEEEDTEDAPAELEEGEVNKLIEVGFREVKYPMWISSIVLVRKKNGQIRVMKLYPSWMDRLDTTKYNADATYQRAMKKIFDDMLHKNVKCYIDDLVVKSKKRENHFHDLRKVFERLRRYQLKMNPSKFGHCQPFNHLMKKDIPFQWDEACDKVFKSIKSYLMKPPVLVAPVPGRPLILYVAAHERSVGILLAQKNDEGKENALYYLSRTTTPNELKYSPIEKLCLSLIFSIQKFKHYFQSHSIHLVSKANPLKYVMAKPVLSDRLARWYLQLQ